MVDLVAKSACDGLLPVTVGKLTLSEASFDAITSLTPLKGRERAVSDALKAQMGAAFPAPNRTTGRAHERVVWSGAGQALVLGPALDPIDDAAMTDQSDAWACAALEGPRARAVLARLVPIDLRSDRFKTGHAARTQLGHMMCVLMRTGRDRYGIMVFRSMAETMVHELKTAMEGVTARG